MSDRTNSLLERPIRFGIIGCGALGLVHAKRLSAIPGVTITALSDPDEDAMRRVSIALGGGVPLFADYRALLDSGALDAVCINSPNRWHVEQLLASLDRGLHVLCEKPLSMVPAEVEQVVAATERAGTTVAIAYQSRYRRDSRILKRALESGRWGRVTSVSVFTCEDWMTPNRGTWRHDPTRCPGGFFADANGHQLDLLFWLTGLEATAVRAMIETRGTPVPMVTWGEARLVANPAVGSGQSAIGEGQSVGNRQSAIGKRDSVRNLQSKSQNGEGVPFTFTFVGDAKHWREEISIQTERADFVMQDTRLRWSDGSAPAGPYPDPESNAPVGVDADTPDIAFVAAMRGGPPVVSPPGTVWPVLNFTLAALDAAKDGSW